MFGFAQWRSADLLADQRCRAVVDFSMLVIFI